MSPIGSSGAASSHAGQPTIQANKRQLIAVVDDAWRAVEAANKPPWWFVRGRNLVHISMENDAPLIRDVEQDGICAHLSRVARWLKDTSKGPEDVFPPPRVARAMLAAPDPTLPPLHAVIETPVFGRDGNVLSTPGYHRGDALWLHLPSDLTISCPAPSPTPSQVAAARSLILEDLLVDFRFATEADRAHAVAAILLPFARRMIESCTPLHLIEAASPGTGKGLLADVISLVSTGKRCAVATLPRESAEVRKKITSILMTAPAVVLLDNVGHHLDSSEFAAALTAETWTETDSFARTAWSACRTKQRG